MHATQLNVCCECSPVVDARYDGSDHSLSVVIVEALAEATGSDPTDLPPLYDVVDLEALDNVIDQSDAETAGHRVVSFSVKEWNVFVCDDGRIRVCDATEHTDPKPVFASGPA